METEFARTGCMPDFTEDRTFWEYPHRLEEITMTLRNRELWQKFNAVGTEMIITKPGRRMFPFVELKLEGLVPEDSYVIVLELRQCSEYRFRFQGNHWVEGVGATYPARSLDNMYVLSPKKGKEWMHESVSMYFVKITNSGERIKQKGTEDRPLLLTSMHKYIPVIHIIKTDSKYNLTKCPMATFVLPEGEFIAVTAYQNVAVKDLKIQYNPFAKAFRPGATSERKRKIDDTSDSVQNSRLSDGTTCSTSVISSSPSTSTSAVEVKVENDLNDQTPTTSPSYSSSSSVSPSYICPPLYPCPYSIYQEQATRITEIMQQYMVVRPWEVPPVTMCNQLPYGFNVPYPIPVFWNSFGYPSPQSNGYPALPAPPTYPYESELIDLSKRTQDKVTIEENPA